EMTFGTDTKEKHEDVKARYEEDKAKGVEVAFVEYMYLSDLINITTEKKLYSILGFSRKEFEKCFGSLNDLRNSVAHPARSIVSTSDSIQRSWGRVDRIEYASF